MSTSPSRVALVTGSGKERVGWYVADALAGQGYALAVHYCAAAADAKETVEHLCSRGVEAAAFQADRTDGEAGRKLIQAVLDRFGHLDVLVDCAAIWKAKRLEDLTAEDLLHNFGVNVLGTFICAREAGLVMVRQAEGGCIINFGEWALTRPYLDYAAYSATKGAVPALTRCLAVELGNRIPVRRIP